jgi:hypothetical protein
MSNPGAQLYHFVNGRMDIEAKPECEPTCYMSKLTAHGDRADITVTAEHPIAERARAARRSWRAWWRKCLWSLFG